MSDQTETPAPGSPKAGSDAPGQAGADKLFDGNGKETQPPAKDAAPKDATPKDAAPKGEGADAPKPEGDKGTDGQARVVPEKYDLKLPAGSLLDAQALERTATFAKENGLTNKEAQAILERESASIASYVESQREALAEKTKEWVETVKNDKEIGGEGFNKTVEMAKRVVDRYGSDSLKQALNDSGLGNHPELVRFVARIGKAMTEDQLILPGSQPAGKKSPEETFYPSTK